MSDPVVPFDLHRMFIGNDPPLMYLEILVRCVVIYAWSLGLLRWIGGRSVTQLSLVEFLLVIALGSAIGDSLFYPQVPLFQAMLVILVVVLINKLLDQAILRWDVAKRIVDGGPIKLMGGGRILVDSISHRTMGQAELTAALRANGIRNLGEVEAVYMEANGQLSVFRRDRPQAGLRIEPPHEIAVPDLARNDTGDLCCESCGLVLPAARLDARRHCPECGHNQWTFPIRADPGQASDE